ncbi:hypothetical protein [Flavisolibacter nicotianae]|uniref:hypothetical protein n=1 Tax=Flavisolibacter nicotianae TaxID=2364882 RepID=UPI000EADFF93|nr:hypothetical protein [Flavisolibacter nicotianae]
MKKITLKFPSMVALWTFRARVHLLNVLILSGAILTCELSDDDINMAVDTYRAVVIDLPGADDGK